MPNQTYDTFDEVANRLKEIADKVGDENLPLDDALNLYEEAVGLGLRASDLLEKDTDAQPGNDELGYSESSSDESCED